MKRTKEQNRKQGKASRRKGAEGELEAAKLWQPWFPHCKRMFPRQQQGVPFPDIGCPKMNENFYVEVKRRRKISDAQVSRFWGQFQDDYDKYTDLFDQDTPHPIIMFRENGRGWHVATIPDHQCQGVWYDAMSDEVENAAGYYTDDGIIIVEWSAVEKYLNKYFTVTEVSGE